MTEFKACGLIDLAMTEEERQKTILELEQEVFGRKPKPSRIIKKCEVCGEKLVKGECQDHPEYLRMQHRVLIQLRKKYQ